MKEQPYEKPIASGQFRYQRDGRPTGAVESWRLSKATAGFEFLRLDLDAREAESGHSYLYHFVRRDDGLPERLAYRFWSNNLDIEGTLLFSETNITGTRMVNRTVFEEDVGFEPETGFWFPSAVGLGLAANLTSGTAVTLNNQVGGEDVLTLKQVKMSISLLLSDIEEVEVAGKMIRASAWQVRWNDSIRLVMQDKNGWPLKIEREDGLTAVETRYIWY